MDADMWLVDCVCVWQITYTLMWRPLYLLLLINISCQVNTRSVMLHTCIGGKATHGQPGLWIVHLSQRYRTQSTCKRTTPVPVLSRTKNKGPGRGPSQVKHPGRKGGRGKSNQVGGRQVLHPTLQVEPQQARPSHSTSRRGKEKAAGKGKGAQKGAV